MPAPMVGNKNNYRILPPFRMFGFVDKITDTFIGIMCGV
jgi:hypothetical protein